MTRFLITVLALVFFATPMGYAGEDAEVDKSDEKVSAQEVVTGKEPAIKPPTPSGKTVISKQRTEQVVIRDGGGNPLVKFYFTYKEPSIPGEDQPASMIITDGQDVMFMRFNIR